MEMGTGKVDLLNLSRGREGGREGGAMQRTGWRRPVILGSSGKFER